MSSGQGSTTNLAQGSQEAFRALISSIAPETVPDGDEKLTPEAIRKLSEKLKEIVGEDAAKDFEHHRNEKGELVNEEGLPIIEIFEPVAGHLEEKNELNDQSTTIHDIPLIRLSSLPSVAREKLRQQRDRILDTLEEEERQEEERQERADREERDEIVRKRKEAAANEQGSLQKAQELQRKMGKALLRNMGSEKDGDSSPAQRGESKGHTDPSDTKQDIRKKAVTFVESGDSVSVADNLGLGDVTAAKLRPSQGPTLLQSFRSDSNPVKLNVIERKPAGASSGTSTRPTFTQTTKDSDDESEPGDSQYPPASEDDESDETRAEQHTDSEAEAELEDQYNLDFAQHQREIALEYYEKRNTIGQETMKAMMDHTHVQDEDETTPETPIQSNRPKASVSRFKANRIASAYGTSSHNEPSTSVAGSVVPESMARTIQHAIRSGRIDDDNRLVGGEHDSDSENETPGLQETLELLRKGEVYNLGQEGHLVTPPRGISSGGPSGGSRSNTGSQQRTQESQLELPPLNRPKVSKFKANLSQAGRPSSTSRSTTPISHAERSSPKLPSALADTVVEKNQPQLTGTTGAGPSQASISSSSSSVTESPPLKTPRPAHPQTNVASQPFTSMIIESPSFPSYSSSSVSPPIIPGSGTTFPPVIIDSPSFPAPGQQRSRRPERPPTVVSSQSLAPGSSSKPIASVSENPRLPHTTAIAPIVQERAAPQAQWIIHLT